MSDPKDEKGTRPKDATKAAKREDAGMDPTERLQGERRMHATIGTLFVLLIFFQRQIVRGLTAGAVKG